jgi:hypothetical protein
MAWQREQDVCTGRGFAGVDANGWCAKFYTWITKNAAAGGPGWYLLRDASNGYSATATPDHTTEEFTVTGHSFKPGDEIEFSTTGTIPSGISSGTNYWCIVVDADTIKVASSLANALNGTATIISNNGTGTLTVGLVGPFIIVADRAAPSNPNDEVKIIKVGYEDSVSSRVNLQHFVSWDATYGNCFGQVSGQRLKTLDSATFAYDFRGNDECLVLQSYIASESTSYPYYGWYTCAVDEWNGLSDFIDGESVIGTTQASITVGASSVQVQLTNSAEAALFTKGHSYFIKNFDTNTQTLHNVQVSYGEVDAIGTADGLPGDEYIRFSTLSPVITNSNVIPSGAKIQPYPLRAVYFDYNWASDRDGYNYRQCQIPFTGFASTTEDEAFYDQSGYIYTGARIDCNLWSIIVSNPNDHDDYIVQRPIVCEYLQPNQSSDSGGMNNTYGTCKNLYLTSDNNISVMQSGRTINSKDYIGIGTAAVIAAMYQSSTSIHILAQHTEEV